MITIRPVDENLFATENLPDSVNYAKLLEGEWENELGSKVQFEVDDTGILSGYYRTAVGNAKGDKLSGYWMKAHEEEGILLGWTVAWRDSTSNLSTTSWSGKLYCIDEKGKQPQYKIVTTWLLTKDTTFDNSWESVLVNKNIFHKISK